MPVDKTRRRPRVSPAGSEWSTPRTRLVHRLSPGLSTGVEGWDTPLRKRPHPLPRTGIHLLEHALGLTRATPLPCTGGPVAVDPARPRWATPPPAHRRSGRRRAGTTGRPASQPSCGRSWGPALPLRPGLTGKCPHDTRSPPALAPGPCCPVEAAGGDPRRAGAARTTPHLRPIRTPAPTGALDGERHRGVIADRDRVGGGGSLPAQCGRARGRRCVRDRRPACSAAGADGQL